MNQRPLKFRQLVGKTWHYWGIIGDAFIAPVQHTSIPSQQFTGLHDKNGKEIYEGDILDTGTAQIVDLDDPNASKRIVGWKQDEARFCLYWMNGRKQTSGFTFCENNAKRWEVIGNIYEHSHLLSEEKS